MAIVANRTEKHSVEEILENFSDLESALYKLEQEDRLSFSMLDNKDRIIDVEFYYDGERNHVSGYFEGELILEDDSKYPDNILEIFRIFMNEYNLTF